ncbi:zinc finger protein 831 isoform X2 [Tachyglossus aculeatus]|uniref:zinc finger protein 831 isoform X2 n=1 Tax=Tachyglossus aculeatus TaxID=9261 RepID=UPI0018F5F9DD|nr:zinc finger protein 831 isoform X2 [Tachyglossus aculeatus]
MEAQRPACSTAPRTDQSVHVSCLQAANMQRSPQLNPTSVIIQPDQGLPPTVYLKTLTIPLFHPIQPGGFQPCHQLVTTSSSGLSLESSNLPLILSPLLHSEKIDPSHSQSLQGQTLTVNIVGSLPVLSPGSLCSSAALATVGKSKNAGKYLCKHCGRDCLKPSVLEKHIRSHTGERPFPCTTCGIAFKTQSNLYKHRRTQTHINNARLSLESDGSSSSLQEHTEKTAENPVSGQTLKLHGSIGEKQVTGTEDQALESSSSLRAVRMLQGPGQKPLQSLPSQSLGTKSELSHSQEPSLSGLDREATLNPESMSSPRLLPANVHQRWKMQEQRSPTATKHMQLQRQQATLTDKHWDFRTSEYKLKKCESTDSGYLSRSDSIEQQMPSSSPLNSLSEHSVEAENETPPSLSEGPVVNNSNLEPGEKATTLTLEKKKLEEHISKLISHNKAVVDDTQLDNVRPRKTNLSKQGSIDLPMPYTYKDSFHFDIRSLDATRKKNITFCSAKSTFNPLDKSKPIFFHSVPTQFSTTIDCVPITRSNSVPFVESTKTWQEKRANPQAAFLAKLPLATSHALRTVDFPNSHPRTLVRQGAVDDLPQTNVADKQASPEETNDSRKPVEEAKCAAGGKKCSQRKLKMFSQEKWQIYGDDTFKKIYQKVKTSQNTKKSKQKKAQVLDKTDSIPDRTEAARGEGMVQQRGSSSRNFTCGSPISSPPAISPRGHKAVDSCPPVKQVSQVVSLPAESGTLAEAIGTSHSVESRATSPTLSCCIAANRGKEVESTSPLLPPTLRPNQRPELQETSANQDCLDLASKLESIPCNDGDSQELHQRAQMIPRLHKCSASKSVKEAEKLPSERKKFKVEEMQSRENPIDLQARRSEGCSEGPETLHGYSDANFPQSGKHSAQKEEGNWDKRFNESTRQTDGTECERGKPYQGERGDDGRANASDSMTINSASFPAGPRPGSSKERDPSEFILHRPADVVVGQQCPGTPAESSMLPAMPPQISESGTSLSPKYILKLPPQQTCPELPVVQGEEQEKRLRSDCRGHRELELDAKCQDRGVGPKWDGPSPQKALKPCLSPGSGSTMVNNNHLGKEEMTKGSQDKMDSECRVDDKTQITEKMSLRSTCSVQATGKKLTFTSMYTSGFFVATDIKGESQILSRLHSGSTALLVTSSSGKGMPSWDSADQLSQGWERYRDSSDGQDWTSQLFQHPVRSPEDTNSCHSFGTFYCQAVTVQHGGHPAQPQTCLIPHSGYPRSSGAKGSFPSLSAEPRLTWCCLSRSLPLPAEQKEKAYSAYSSLHICHNNPEEKGSGSRCDFSLLDMKNVTKTVTYSLTSGSLKTLASSLSWGQPKQKACSIAAEQEEKQGTPSRRGKMITNQSGRNNKQKKLKISPKRPKRGQLQGHAQLKISKQHKQHLALRKIPEAPKKPCLPYTQDGLGQSRDCHPSLGGLPGQSLEDVPPPCATPEISHCQGDDCQDEDSNCRNNSGTFFHSLHSRNLREKDKLNGKDISQFPECSDLLYQNTTAASGLSLQTISCLAGAESNPHQSDSVLNICSVVTQPLAFPKSILNDSNPSSCSAPLGSFSVPTPSGFKGIFHQRDAANLRTTSPVTSETRTRERTLALPKPAVQGPGLAVSETLAPSARNKPPAAEDNSNLIPIENAASGTRILNSASLRTIATTSRETPASGTGKRSFYPMEVRPMTYSPPGLPYKSGEMDRMVLLSGSNSGNRPKSKGQGCPGPAEATDIAGMPSKTMKKKGLEGMRKQSCVEYSDTSSDDEDRLVIEI